jgi:hypothetical protein
MNFISLLERLFGKSPNGPLYKLTELQLKQLRDLTRHPGWKLYVEVLDNYTSQLGEYLLTADHDKLPDIRSEIRGLRNAPLLVAQVLTNKELNDERRTDALATATDRTQGERAHYTGPYAVPD